ncbi:MAG TPA: hypothetical protein VGJ96_04645 [Gemmatimonadaceae bacterium]|jgi:hypothetical protein
MPKFIRVAAVPLALVVAFGACKKADDVPADSRQVELAPANAGQPQLADTAQRAATKAPAKPAATAAKPAASAPAARPAPAAAKAATTGTIAGGTSMEATSSARVCTNTIKAGDHVTAALAEPVAGTNGVTVPAGSVVTLRVTEAKRGENGKEGVRLAFEPVSVAVGTTTYDVTGSVRVANIETVRAQSTGDQAKKVAAGAAVGAIAGQLLGKKTKSTVAGAAVGAAAGGVIAAGTADWNGCVANGGRMTITLGGPLTISLAK